MSRADREAAAEAQHIVGSRSLGRTRSSLGNGNLPDPAGSGTTGRLDEEQQVSTNPGGGRRRPRGDNAQQTDPGSRPPGPSRSARITALLSDNQFGEIPIAVASDEDVEMRSHTTTEDETANLARGDRHAETSSRHGEYGNIFESSSDAGRSGEPGNPGPGDATADLDHGDGYVPRRARSPGNPTSTDEFATDDGPATYQTPRTTEHFGRLFIQGFKCPQSGRSTTARIEGSPVRSRKVTLTLSPISQGRPAYTVQISELGLGDVKFPTLEMISPNNLRSEIQNHGVPGVLFVAPQTPLNPTADELACMQNPQRYPTTHLKLQLNDDSRWWTTRSTWLSLVRGGQHIIDAHFENVGQRPPNKPLTAASRAIRQENGERWRDTHEPASPESRRNPTVPRTTAQTPPQTRNRPRAQTRLVIDPPPSSRSQARGRGRDAAEQERQAPRDVCPFPFSN